MGFLRSKSRTPADETEPQRRNRLSKPLTNKSQTNLRASARQEGGKQNSPAGSSHPSSVESLGGPFEAESKTRVNSYLYTPERSTIAGLPVTKNSPVKTGVASLVARFEATQPAASVSQQSLNVPGEFSRPLSTMTTTLHPLSLQKSRKGYIGSTEHLAAFRNSAAYRTSPNESLDQLVDPFAIPSRRPSKYKPGEATRQTDHPQMPEALPADYTRFSSSRKEDDALSFLEGEDVVPEVAIELEPEVRTGTPTNLDRQALGNLSLGSLCVINGRVSPALSEMPKHVQTRRILMPSRQVSSNYANSEIWEDETIHDDLDDARPVTRYASLNRGRREYSYIPGAEARMTYRNDPNTFQRVTNAVPQTPKSRSHKENAVSAEEYMAELPASPFAELESSSSGGSIRSMESVIHHSVPDDDHDERDSFQDDSIIYSSPMQKRDFSVESKISAANSHPSVVESKLSSVDSQLAPGEAFRSALEFQPIPPRSPDRPKYDFDNRQSVHSDSGYGSKNSLSVAEADPDKYEKIQSSTVVEEVHPALRNEASPRKLEGFLPLRPALKSRATAEVTPMAIIPEPKPSRPSTDSSAKSVAKSEKASAQPSKFRRKLQKSRPNSFVGTSQPVSDIVVQRNISEELFDVPAISPAATANLNLRHQTVPELEYVVRNDSYQPTMSTTCLVSNVRFPSPFPDLDEGDRKSRKSKGASRNRSKSRRRSFLSIFSRDKDNDKRASGVHQPDPELTIDDLGDVVTSLGSNPYDIADPAVHRSDTSLNRRRSREISPYNMSVQRQSRPPSIIENQTPIEPVETPTKVARQFDGFGERQRSRPKSMMDDKTASEFARSRSRSVHKRESWGERRTSFNDRAGFPGRNLHATNAAEDAPPVPPIPQHKELRPISWCNTQSPSSYIYGTPRSEEPSWLAETTPEPERPPPPPPAHSPRPSFVEHRNEYLDYDEQAMQGQREEEDVVTNSPCRSPRPSPIENGHGYHLYGQEEQNGAIAHTLSYSPHPSFVADSNQYLGHEEQEEEEAIAPPPPSHSPRPTDLAPEPEGMTGDAWAAQARAWKARRQSAGERLKDRWSTNVELHHDTGAYEQDVSVFEDDEVYPVIPPRQQDHQYNSVENHYQYPAQNQSYVRQPEYSQQVAQRAQTWNEPSHRSSYNYHVTSHYNHDTPQHWTPQPVQQHYQLRHEHNHQQHQPLHAPNHSRPLPNPTTPRPTSRHSHHSARSYASSIAEELHPSDMQRRSPAPEFSRYSGGLDYGYEGRDTGFGGSAGTRNVSGKADGRWKETELRKSWGVDLGDVPVIGVAVRV